MPGIMIVAGADLRISGIRLEIADDGTVSAPPVTPHLRTDMWPHWLRESIDAARLAQAEAAKIPGIREEDDQEALAEVTTAELRASMRAITSAAFAVDAFYSAVAARSPTHPHAQLWRTREGRRTPRHSQIFETLRYSLKLQNPGATEIRKGIKELFKFRGWAVHPGSRYREPVYRSDLDAGVDWHFMAFRSENATACARLVTNMLDVMISKFDRGPQEVREAYEGARRFMNELLAYYDASDLPAFPRAEP